MNIDKTPRYTPAVVMTLRGKRPVVRVIAYAPNGHPEKCPLVASCTAVELITDIGVSRWYGVEEAHIDSSLRMVVTGFPAGFEEMAAWEKVPAEKPPTLAQAKRICKALGVTLKYDRDLGEYNCNLTGGKEATRYYTDDLMDAIGTAKYMAAHQAAKEVK